MPSFRISISNKDVQISDYHELEDAEAARAMATEGALQIGVEELCGGHAFFGAEVRIDRDDEVVERFVVAMGLTPIQ